MRQVVVQFQLGIGSHRLGPESEFQKLQKEVDRDCSVNDFTSDIVGAWVPEWVDEWIAEFLPNHSSLKKDAQ